MHLGGINNSFISEKTKKKGRKKQELRNQMQAIKKNNSVAAGIEYF